MIVTTKAKMLSLGQKKFDNDKGEEISFTQAVFADDEGNRFEATVPKEKIEAVKFDEKKPDTELTINLIKVNNKVKMYLVATK